MGPPSSVLSRVIGSVAGDQAGVPVNRTGRRGEHHLRHGRALTEPTEIATVLWSVAYLTATQPRRQR
jgi:hypothetical protein